MVNVLFIDIYFSWEENKKIWFSMSIVCPKITWIWISYYLPRFSFSFHFECILMPFSFVKFILGTRRRSKNCRYACTPRRYLCFFCTWNNFNVSNSFLFVGRSYKVLFFTNLQTLLYTGFNYIFLWISPDFFVAYSKKSMNVIFRNILKHGYSFNIMHIEHHGTVIIQCFLTWHH